MCWRRGFAASLSADAFSALRCPRHPHSAAGRCRRICALGLLTSDFAARPGKIVRAAGGRRQRFALDQRSGGERVNRCGPRSWAAKQLIGPDGRGNQRHDRSRQGTWRWLARNRVGVGCCRFGRQCDRRGVSGQNPRNFALDVVSELARAGFRKIHAVGRTELAGLTLDIGSLLQEAPGVVDKSVPDIDVSDAGPLGGVAI